MKVSYDEHMNDTGEQATGVPQPQQAFQNTQQEHNVNKDIAFGVGEIIFVLIALLLLFGTLNYFQILPVSSTVPFLSFLPQKSIPIIPTPVQTSLQPKQKPNTYLPIVLDDPSLSSAVVSYLIEGVIENIATQPNNTNILLSIRSNKGTNLPQPIAAAPQLPVSETGTSSAKQTVKDLKVGAKIMAVFSYSSSAKNLSLNTIQLLK